MKKIEAHNMLLESGNKKLELFIEKLIFYSAGILTTSLTLFLAFFKSEEIFKLKIYFIFIWGLSLIVIIQK